MTTSFAHRCLRERAATARRSVTAAIITCAALAMAGCAMNPQPPPGAPSRSTYRIGPPDQLEISVLPDPAIERSVTVRPDGQISFDLIGDVKAAGRTPDEVAQDIERRISRYKRDARVTVVVATSLTDSITIFGEVRVPGNFPLERDTRLADAIGLRGGPTTFARKGRVRVIRVVGDETSVLIVDLGAIMRGDLTSNVLLQRGDIIVVPPTIIARVGYTIQMLVFPFTTIINPALTAVNLSRTF